MDIVYKKNGYMIVKHDGIYKVIDGTGWVFCKQATKKACMAYIKYYLL